MKQYTEGERCSMILSVSRRTDIPNYYADWFYNRIKEGFLYVRNPFNPHQISRIDLSPDVVDCIVFWTKNPSNMLERLDELRKYAYYFQFTLTGYGRDVEPRLPDKRQVLIPVFQRLSRQLGAKRVVWRYDPILVNRRYTAEYHIKAFGEIARSLEGFTERVVISFVDLYAKTRRSMKELGIEPLAEQEMFRLAEEMAALAKKHGMTVMSCAETIDIQRAGIEHGSCIDKKLIEEIIGCELTGGKDKNQRHACGCFESVETGLYNTCKNGCKYCYANSSDGMTASNIERYDPMSPLLCGAVGPEDRVTERKMRSLKAYKALCR